MKKLVILALCGSLMVAGQVQGADLGRIVKSAVFPGMGQLSDGNGELTSIHTVKGLAFMSLEAIALSLTVAEVSKASSYARETAYIKERYHLSSTYEERLREFNGWQDAFDKSQKSKTMTMAFGGLAAAVWILNVVDVVVFTPSESEQSLINGVLDNTVVLLNTDGAKISYKVHF